MEEKKKVLIITYYWPPSGGAGVQRWLKFAKYLPEFDVEPIILTVDPEYASYPQMDESLGKDISSDLKVFKTKSFEPLSVLSGLFGKKSVPYGGFTNVNKASLLQTILRFIRGNFFIPDARVGWNKFAVKKAKKIISEFNIDTVITTGPPHSTHLVGLKLKKNPKIKWIADFRDPWTDIYYYKDLLHTGVVKRIDRKKERKVLKEADQVITVGETLKNKLKSKVNLDKFKIISNGFDEEDFEGFTLEKPEKFTITYTGTLSDQYNIETFIKACKLLKDEGEELIIRFIGSISVNQLELFESAGLKSNLELVNYLAHRKSIEFLYKSSVLLLAIPEFINSKEILTGKLFEYLASGVPVIGIGPAEGDAANIIKECNSGNMFDYSDKSNIYNYLKILINSRGDISLVNSIREKYSRKNLTEQLKELL